MSAIAVAVSAKGDKVVLISDGMATQDGEIYALDAPKVVKVNDHVAIQHMGIGWYAIGKYVISDIRKDNVTDPEQITWLISRHLQEVYTRENATHLFDSHLFWFMCMGYHQGELKTFKLYSAREDKFTPEEDYFKPGSMGAKTQTKAPKDTPFQKLLATKYWPLYKPHLEHAVQEAFKEMVKECQSEGENVGGKIFMETITSDSKMSPHAITD